MAYGKSTGMKDSNGKIVYEFDRVINESTGEKGTVFYREYPSNPGQVPYVLKDDGTFLLISKFGAYEVLLNENADLDFVKKFDYRRMR